MGRARALTNSRESQGSEGSGMRGKKAQPFQNSNVPPRSAQVQLRKAGHFRKQ